MQINNTIRCLVQKYHSFFVIAVIFLSCLSVFTVTYGTKQYSNNSKVLTFLYSIKSFFIFSILIQFTFSKLLQHIQSFFCIQKTL
ncbi:hypothetical protein T4A_8269 [Trichinella pseudospiralis]|uniref:Uncharacterized protein n=1 Tax=Trichinella pseudospiralis TaxID=6337 RepID=A0A0V1ERB8_TRIPS|nr:hypothetical protein T4A_8269 [Trichinella pseudospiralis]